MNTDDRALANLIAELRGLLAKATEPGPPEGLVDSDSAERPMCSTNAMVWRDYYDRRNKAANALVSELPTLLDRLEAFHAKPVVGRWPDRESIADAFLLSPHRVQNGDRQHANPADYIEYIRTYKSASLGEARRVADFVLSLPGALAALQSPPPVVSGEAKRPSHLSVIPVKGHPEKHAVYDAIMGDAIAVCPDEIAAQMVFDALTKADTPPVVEEGRREALVRTIADYQHKRGLTWEEACEDANGIADAILALTPVSGVGDVTRHLEALADNNPDKPADWLSGVMDAISAIRALSTPVAAQGDVREALKPYTQHLVGCRMRLRQGASECTCGLTSALATLGSPHAR